MTGLKSKFLSMVNHPVVKIWILALPYKLISCLQRFFSGLIGCLKCQNLQLVQVRDKLVKERDRFVKVRDKIV